MCNNLYVLLLQYFDSPKRDDKNKQEIELQACKYAITTLIPLTENRIYNCSQEYMPKYYELWEKAYAFAGRRSLEHFIDYMEMDMPVESRVLANRRNVLKPFVFFLNKSAFDPKLQYIEASFPPGYGKSYTLNMFSAWIFGIDITNSILRWSYSQELVLGFSRAIQSVIKNPRFSEIFPEFRKYGDKPFEKEKESDWILKGSGSQKSHIARTRDGASTGERANKALIFDDMTKGAEEATNSEVHRKIYESWSTEWFNRRTDPSVTYIFVGTMWSPEDILNRTMGDIEATHQMQPCKIKGFEKFVMEATDGYAVFIKVPLLDENDESTCPPVMTTVEARRLRDTTDPFLYSCVYQQEPIAPTGLEFADDLLNHYDELPKNEKGEELCQNYCFAVLDPARRGKDNVSMPIFKTDGVYYYFFDCVFKQKAMTDLYDEIVDKIIEHNITVFVVENNIDTSLKTLLEEKLKAKNCYTCEIIEKYNTIKKEQRIKDNRGLIKKLIYFKDKRIYRPNTDYGRFMKNFTTYSFDYANKHDDAPDSMAMFVTEIILGRGKPNKPKPINRLGLGI